MRRGAALAAAALLALLGAAPSCKPSSLTPFTDWREPETATGVNGLWRGETFSPGVPRAIEFTIASETLVDWTLQHEAFGCPQTFVSNGSETKLDGTTFDIDSPLEEQGRIVIHGEFTSDTECSGTYFFEAISETGVCPTSGSGTFVATKVN